MSNTASCKYIIITVFFCSILISDSFSQIIDTALYRKDNLGSQVNRKQTILDGNNIVTIAYNNGEIGQWPYSPSLKWPNDSTGLNYFDGLSLLIGAEAITNKGIQIHPLETYYREEMDNPNSYPGIPPSLLTEPLGFAPVSGYFNSSSSQFAKSNDPSTWPEKWPSALNLPESQNGKWINSLFPFSKSANLESFYVMDDSKDFEFTYPLPLARGRYYPIKYNEPKVGSTTSEELKLYYDPTIRKGLGLRIEAHTLQWNTPKLKNTLFIINDIYNLSSYSYNKIAVGLYLDPSLGGNNDNEGENAIFDSLNNILIFSDVNGFVPGRTNIRSGMIYLETPGENSNSLDDDHDGIIDESQTNGIDDDGDWDVNLNDIGKDGIANTNDEGEGDGIPTIGEPNFEVTDPDEIDMKRITTVNTSKLVGKTSDDIWPKNDEVVWKILSSNSINTGVQNNNIQVVTATNVFSLPVQNKIRFSYAVIFGKDSTEFYQNVKWAREAYGAGFTKESVEVGIQNKSNIKPGKIQLNQNYPNPFNPTTSISFNLPFQSDVSLKVYDLLGREIQTLHNGNLNSGIHRFSFNGSKLTSGIYFVKLISGEFSETKKMVLMK